ncbi:hypothetical protein DMJ13_17375 [halophilic archaeon]|nr:hypothetical protein DMJ13_17375 [halophilic archaeon]
MGAKTVRIEVHVYEMIRAKKREDETFSEAIERLVGGGSLLNLYGAGNEEDVENMRDVVDETKEKTRGGLTNSVTELRPSDILPRLKAQASYKGGFAEVSGLKHCKRRLFGVRPWLTCASCGKNGGPWRR